MTREIASPLPSLLTSYLDEVSKILDREAPLKDQVGAVGAATKRLVTSGLVLPPSLSRVQPGVPYTRNLVHEDPRKRFTVIAIIWGPSQETAIHDHVNWCVVGVLQGLARVTNFDRIDDGMVPGKAQLRVREQYLTKPGTVAELLPPPRSNVHQMADAGGGPTITIHTYGDPGTRARVFDLQAETYKTVELKFHNLEG
jgi:predicted metal-dependent enzyme (double-stranded beta helix superfamily)